MNVGLALLALCMWVGNRVKNRYYADFAGMLFANVHLQVTKGNLDPTLAILNEISDCPSFADLSNALAKFSELKRKTVPPETALGTSTVEEIANHSQALQIDGQSVAIRGWFSSDPETGDYFVYHSAWDPFEPQTRHSISSIALRFNELPADLDDWAGQHLNVQGTIATEPLESGKRKVLLKDARIISERMAPGSGTRLPYQNKARQESSEAPTNK
jgi:hypothetical protein